MSGRQRVRTVIQLEQRRTAARAEPEAAAPEPPALYGVALLKAALELKRSPEGSVEEVLRRVLARMHIPEGEFFAWAEQQGTLKALLGG